MDSTSDTTCRQANPNLASRKDGRGGSRPFLVSSANDAFVFTVYHRSNEASPLYNPCVHAVLGMDFSKVSPSLRCVALSCARFAQ